MQMRMKERLSGWMALEQSGACVASRGGGGDVGYRNSKSSLLRFPGLEVLWESESSVKSDLMSACWKITHIHTSSHPFPSSPLLLLNAQSFH